MSKLLLNAAQVAGLAAIVYGVALVSVAVAWIVAGLLVVAVCEVRS